MNYPWIILFINLSLAVILNKFLNLNLPILIPILAMILSLAFNGVLRFLTLNVAVFLLGINISYKEYPTIHTDRPIFVECSVVSFPTYKNFGSIFDCKVINSSQKEIIGKILPVFVRYEENIYFLSTVAFIGKIKKKQDSLILQPTANFIKVDNSDNFLYPLFKIRETFIHNYRNNSINYETFSVGTALIFGERRYLDFQSKKPFYESGLAHLIAISGTHIAILFLSLTFLFFFLSERKRYILLGVILPFYAIFTGFAIPVVRAVFMGLMYIFSKLFNLRNNSLNILFFSAFIFVFLSPQSLFSISFQLSFLAVFGIILSLQVFSDANNFQKIFISSIFATLFSMPIVLYYFGNFSPTTIFATPIATLPLYPLLTLSVVNIITSFQISFLVKLMDFFTMLFIQTVLLFSKLGLYFTGFNPSILSIIIYLSILVFILIYKFDKSIKIFASIFVSLLFLILSRSDLSPKVYVFENRDYPAVLFSNSGSCFLFSEFESKRFLNVMAKEGCIQKILFTEKKENFSDDFLSEFEMVKDYNYQVSFKNIHYKKWIEPILVLDGKVFQLKNQDYSFKVKYD